MDASVFLFVVGQRLTYKNFDINQNSTIHFDLFWNCCTTCCTTSCTANPQQNVHKNESLQQMLFKMLQTCCPTTSLQQIELVECVLLPKYIYGQRSFAGHIYTLLLRYRMPMTINNSGLRVCRRRQTFNSRVLVAKSTTSFFVGRAMYVYSDSVPSVGHCVHLVPVISNNSSSSSSSSGGGRISCCSLLFTSIRNRHGNWTTIWD